jgi:hypothetical protein
MARTFAPVTSPGAPEQAVPVERRAQRPRRRALRDHADDVREHRVARDALGLAVGTEAELRAGWAARRIEEAGHLDVAADACGVAQVAPAVECHGLLGSVIRDVRIRGEDRLAPGRNAVRQIRVAELRERLVADPQGPAAEALAAGNGEVPGEVELLALDAGAPERVEDLLEVGAAGVDPGVGLLVAERAEGWLGIEEVALRVAQVPERDDVALALVEILRRPDDQRDVARVRRVGVELGPDQLTLERARVDDDDRLGGVVGPLDVRDRHGTGAPERLGRVEARDLGHHHVARAEAVAPVVGRRADGLPEAVLRHPVLLEGEPLARGAGGIRVREVVVGPRIEAGRRIERIAGERAASRQQHERGSNRSNEHPCPHAAISVTSA